MKKTHKNILVAELDFNLITLNVLLVIFCELKFLSGKFQKLYYTDKKKRIRSKTNTWRKDGR